MSAGLAWILLCVAGLLEITWLLAMKHSQGFTKLWPTVFVFVLGTLSSAEFVALDGKALRRALQVGGTAPVLVRAWATRRKTSAPYASWR